MGNVTRHQQAHQAFNKRDWEQVATLVDDGCTYTDHGRDVTVKSGQEFAEYLQAWPTMLSDAQVTEPTYYEAGDTTICTFIAVGTNDGPLGTFPASGNRLSWPLCEVLTWGPDGTITAGELYYDSATILIQAGHMEAPPKV